MTDVPVKIEHEGKWVVVKASIGEDRITFPAPVEQRSSF